jgi:ribosomal protein S6--L-glutamate ligase
LDTDDLIKWLEVPLDRKITRRNTRKRVVLAETKAAESVINAFKSLNANILVQIYQSQWKDIRCFVIDGKVVAAIRTMPGEFQANIHLGGTASIIKVTAEEKENSY